MRLDLSAANHPVVFIHCQYKMAPVQPHWVDAHLVDQCPDSGLILLDSASQAKQFASHSLFQQFFQNLASHICIGLAAHFLHHLANKPAHQSHLAGLV
jgi:hypothetical protein